MAKLTEVKVLENRRRASDGETRGSLAQESGVSTACITGIVLRRRWRHIRGGQ